MFGSIVPHVAPLAQRREVAGPVVAGIVVQVRGGEHDMRRRQWGRGRDPGQCRLPARHVRWRGEASHPPPAPVAPAGGRLIPPDAVPQVQHAATMGSAAMLAAATGALEADERRQFAPIDRVEPAMFGRDRHGLVIESGKANPEVESPTDSEYSSMPMFAHTYGRLSWKSRVDGSARWRMCVDDRAHPSGLASGTVRLPPSRYGGAVHQLIIVALYCVNLKDHVSKIYST